jgi:hypothetical protein
VKQFTIGITVLLFLASSSLGGLEPLPVGFDFDTQASLSTFDSELSSENHAQRRSLKRSQRGRPEDDDSSSENATGRRTLKRSPRGKAALKSLPAVEKSVREPSPGVRVREASFILHSSKARVYQQTNVYRI